MKIPEIATPSLLLDLDVLERNLARMAQRAAALGVTLRPHIKTHKCLEVAQRQRDLGAVGLTVSTLHEARVFADDGFTDLTWAFPVILSRREEIRELAERATLRLVVDSEEAVRALEDMGLPLHVWLKVTTAPASIPSPRPRWSWPGGSTAPIRCASTASSLTRAMPTTAGPGRRSLPRRSRSGR